MWKKRKENIYNQSRHHWIFRGSVTSPDLSVTVDSCITHKITILKHLYLERSLVMSLLLLLEMYA